MTPFAEAELSPFERVRTDLRQGSFRPGSATSHITSDRATAKSQLSASPAEQAVCPSDPPANSRCSILSADGLDAVRSGAARNAAKYILSFYIVRESEPPVSLPPTRAETSQPAAVQPEPPTAEPPVAAGSESWRFRHPIPMEALVDALQDRIHTEPGISRPARISRARRT